MNDDISLDELESEENMTMGRTEDENVGLGEDDDVAISAESLGVIGSEDDEVDILRVPYQSDISNSPPPESGMPMLTMDDEELEDQVNVIDLETDIELTG